MRERILRIRTQDAYRFVQAAVLVCILFFDAGELIGAGDIKAVHFLIAFAVFTAMLLMRKMAKKGRVFSALALIIILGMTFGIRNCFLFIQSYAGWLIGMDMWEPAWVTGYEVMQVIVAAVCCYILQCFLEKYFPLKIAVMCMLLGALAFCLLNKKTISHAGVVFSLAYIVAAGGEWIERCWDKEKSKDRKAYMFWIMPYMVVYVLVMLWMPAPKKPFDWQFVRSAFMQVRESFIVLTQNIIRGRTENFDTALSGFPEDGKIWGNLEDDHRPVMVIQGEKERAGNVYLAGRAYDAFDGRQWYREDTNTTGEVFLDTILTRYAAERFEGRYLHESMSLTTLKVRYQYFNSAYIFVPLKTQRIMEGSRDLSFIPNGGSLFFADSHDRDTDKRGYGTEYEAVYYQLNAGSEEFEDFLVSMQKEYVQTDAAMEALLKERVKKTGIDITTEDISSYIRQVNEIYSEDVVLSDEVRQYVDEITESAHNDIEKLRMIEAKLASYAYTESPGKLPDTVGDAGSFLDYFLMESKKGYCTYYATAFALLARAEGFPSRYVQGFCVPVEQGRETVVYSDMAHSWPEVYINGVGWIPFEPTPGYGSLRYTPWETERKNTTFAVPAGDYDQGAGEGAADSIAASDAAEELAAERALRRERIAGNSLKIAVCVILVFGAAGSLFVMVERIVRKKRYQKMDPERKFSTAVQDNMRIMSWLGLRRSDVETLQEFGGRAAVQLGLSKNQLTFIEKYESLLYGEKGTDEAAINEVRSEGKQLLGILKAKKKKTYFYYRARVYFD